MCDARCFARTYAFLHNPYGLVLEVFCLFAIIILELLFAFFLLRWQMKGYKPVKSWWIAFGVVTLGVMSGLPFMVYTNWLVDGWSWLVRGWLAGVAALILAGVGVFFLWKRLPDVPEDNPFGL